MYTNGPHQPPINPGSRRVFPPGLQLNQATPSDELALRPIYDAALLAAASLPVIRRRRGLPGLIILAPRPRGERAAQIDISIVKRGCASSRCSPVR
jgi:hypothetical protein